MRVLVSGLLDSDFHHARDGCRILLLELSQHILHRLYRQWRQVACSDQIFWGNQFTVSGNAGDEFASWPVKPDFEPARWQPYRLGWTDHRVRVKLVGKNTCHSPLGIFVIAVSGANARGTHENVQILTDAVTGFGAALAAQV